MNKFMQTIHNLYNKVLPIAQNSGVELNLDYSDPSSAIEIDVETDDPELKAELEEELKNAISRTNSGSVKLKVTNGSVTITDTGTVLSRPLCESLSHGRVKVKSRIGFGTSINISLAKNPEDPENSDKAKKSEVNGKSSNDKLIEAKPKKLNAPSKADKSDKTAKTSKATNPRKSDK